MRPRLALLILAASCLAWRWLRFRIWWNHFIAEQRAKVWEKHTMGHRRRRKSRILANLEIDQCPYCAKARDGARSSETTHGR